MSTNIFYSGSLDVDDPGAYVKYMSEDRAPYKRPGQPEESITSGDQDDALKIRGEHDRAELEQIIRALQVHKTWIWSDGLRMVKMADRIRNLEHDMAEMKGRLDRFAKLSEN